MRILVVSNYYPEHIGGIEIVASNLVKRLRKLHHVRWMACDVKPNAHSPEPDDLPLPAWNFTEEHLGFPYPLPTGRSASLILEEVRSSDVVHVHDCLYAASWMAFVASRLWRKPLLVTQHTALSSYPQAHKRLLQGLAFRTLGRLLLGNSEQVVFVSPLVRNWFESQIRFKKDAVVIPNGIDHDLFFPPTADERENYRARMAFSPSEIILLFVGRFMQNKGIDVVHQIAQWRPDLHWLLIGGGEINPSEWNLPNVEVMPPQPQAELRQYYAMADLLVLPSVGEGGGFPLVVKEALACALPVAVSQETADQLPDAPVIGLDVDSLPGILQSMDQLFASAARLPALRSPSTAYADRWDWDDVALRYEKLLNELVHSSASG